MAAGFLIFRLEASGIAKRYPKRVLRFRQRRAETKARDQVFQARTSQLGKQDFCEFVSEMYLPWAKANKRTWRNDEIIANRVVRNIQGQDVA